MKFKEDKVLIWVENYIRSTYDLHYSKNKIETTEFVFDAEHGEGFCIGNIIKYAQRYGKKDGYNEKDLLKIIHYAIILLGSEHYDKK
tara:strand:- start:1788 stop:2048 length:261 start_codon:yes stop_codon:yes gene_type:complete